MIKIVIPVSGQDYQDMAAWAAPTYALLMDRPDLLSVILPEDEPPNYLLSNHAKRFGFSLGTFKKPEKTHWKYTAPLKCSAFLQTVERLNHNDVVFMIDADTVLYHPLEISPVLSSKILRGYIGLAKCGGNFHVIDPDNPWFVPPEKRLTHVNSGVILAGRVSADMFKTFFELSNKPQVVCASLCDQLVINYSLDMYYSDRFVLLDRCYNSMGPPVCQRQVAVPMISHMLGGPNNIHRGGRRDYHRNECMKILRGKYDR